MLCRSFNGTQLLYRYDPVIHIKGCTCVSILLINLKYKSMLIKEAKYKKVMVERNQCVEEAVYGCDECKCEINDYPNEASKLDMTVFYKEDKEPECLHFCSWECVIKKLQIIECDFFIDLPNVIMDHNGKKSGKYLIKLLSGLVSKL